MTDMSRRPSARRRRDVMVAALLGVSGLVYRAAGQSAPGQGREAGKPRTELEALRREVDLLKFNLEVVLEKCQAQEKELRALRGQVGNAGDAKKLAEDPEVKRAYLGG